MTTVLFITGASSGIGAAFVEQVPAEVGRVVTFSRRETRGEWHQADLADPSAWPQVVDTMAAVLDESGADHAIFFHCSGAMDPISTIADYEMADYTPMILLNFASGASVGQGFLAACNARGVRATLVLASSPAAHKVVPGLSAYCATKLGLEHWGLCAASEQTPDSGTRVMTVVPYAVLTDMVRTVMKEDPADVPLVDYFRTIEAADDFATPELTAEQIWAVIDSGVNGAIVNVGAVWIPERAAAAAAGN